MYQRSDREDYTNYIKSFAWKKKKLEFYKIYRKQCQACQSRTDIHVHHRTYDRFGNEQMEDLRAVCSSCHQKIHDLQNKGHILEVATDIIINGKPRIRNGRGIIRKQQKLSRRKRKKKLKRNKALQKKQQVFVDSLKSQAVDGKLRVKPKRKNENSIS